jgi:hypothetical protein
MAAMRGPKAVAATSSGRLGNGGAARPELAAVDGVSDE